MPQLEMPHSEAIVEKTLAEYPTYNIISRYNIVAICLFFLDVLQEMDLFYHHYK